MGKKIMSFGEILWDILPDFTVLGGAPFNFAYRVKTLGEESLFVSRIGHDELGEAALQKVKALGLDTFLLQNDYKFPTGTVLVSFDENNSPDYIILPHVAFDNIKTTDRLLQNAQDVDCICFGTLIQREFVSRDTLRNILKESTESIKFLDINLRKKCFTKETLLFSIEQAHILKLNDDEVQQIKDILGLFFNSLYDFCVFALNEWDLDYVLLTLGEQGAFAISSKGQQIYEPGYKIKLIDSLGSGDAFSAAFIHKILRGESLESACRLGNALGALVASTPGATAVISQKEIDDLQNNNNEERLSHPEFK